MSLIGKQVQPFTAQAYRNGEFVEVTDESMKGQWSVVCFYLLISASYVQQN